MDFVTTSPPPGEDFPTSSTNIIHHHHLITPSPPSSSSSSSRTRTSASPLPSASSRVVTSISTTNTSSSRYESQKRRDWNTFCQYLKNHQRPPVTSLSVCNGGHVLEFMRYLDQFGKTKVHNQSCHFFGIKNPPSPCACPLRQAWGSLDALIGRLRAAYEEYGGGNPELNPFGTRVVRLFLRDVRDFQSKSRGISYEKKRKRTFQKVPPHPPHDHHHGANVSSQI